MEKVAGERASLVTFMSSEKKKRRVRKIRFDRVIVMIAVISIRMARGKFQLPMKGIVGLQGSWN